MALRHMLDDGQAQAGAASFTRTAAINAVKPLCQAPQVLGCNARTGISHRKNHATVRPLPHADPDVAACRGVAHGITDQIPHGTEQLTRRANQKTVKVAFKDKVVVGRADLSHHLRQRQRVILELAHQRWHRHPCLHPRRGAAFEF